MYLANHLKKLNSSSKISYVKAWQLQVYVTIVTSAVSQSLATCLAAIFFVTGSLQLQNETYFGLNCVSKIRNRHMINYLYTYQKYMIHVYDGFENRSVLSRCIILMICIYIYTSLVLGMSRKFHSTYIGIK